MKQISIVKPALKLALVGVTGLLVACGSSGSSAPADATISGTIAAAPVDNAEVNVEDAGGNHVAGPVYTDINGQYTGLVIPNGSLAQDLIIKSTGGTFTDEATGNKDVPAGEMLAYVAAGSISNGSSVSATPGSTIIANIVMDPDNKINNLADAEKFFNTAFGYTPDVSVPPAAATTVPAVDETDASTLAGFRAAAFSQLALDLGLKSDQQFDMLSALAQDLSDEKLDGVDASGVVDIGTTGSTLEANIQNRFAKALINFHDSGYNQTDLNSAQIGNLPFGKIAFTNNDLYQIEYVQMGTMGAMDGKSTFQIHITNRDTGADESALMPMLMPMMHMAEHNHSTPKLGCIKGATAGYYDCTVYYLMASQMMDGTSMGYWDLTFTTVDGEKAHFYPTVMMAMPGTIQVRLKGVDDKVMAKDDNGDPIMVSRPYFIFKENLAYDSGMDLYDFSVFIAAKEDMMSFPAIVDGEIFNELKMNELIIDIANSGVSVSVNDGAWTPPIATDGTDGIWTATDLSLNSGVANQVRIRLTVNGEVKTTDGLIREVDVNDYQTFTVTPVTSGGMVM